MNNIVLDVAIGLIFIYLLYSLLATTINELVAMIFAYRHRMLEKGIEQMLDGKNYSYYWWDKLSNSLWWLYYKAKDINKLNNSITDNKITAKDFFKTAKVNKSFAKITSEGNTYIKRRKRNKKAALFVANIINYPLYRRKAENTPLYDKPAYLTASAFSDILFDVLSDRRSKTNALPVLMNDIKSFVNTNTQVNNDLKSILNIFIVQANGDVQKFKLLIEDWFNCSSQYLSFLTQLFFITTSDFRIHTLMDNKHLAV